MIDWQDVVSRFRQGDRLQPVAGASVLTVESIDDDRMCLRQRLWRDCLTRSDLRLAARVLADAPPGVTAVQLAELIRLHHTGSAVTPGCSRVPNLAAVVLYNMGEVPGQRRVTSSPSRTSPPRATSA